MKALWIYLDPHSGVLFLESGPCMYTFFLLSLIPTFLPSQFFSDSERPSNSCPELVCGRRLLEVGLSRAGLETAGLNAFSAHLADLRCSSHQEANGTVWFQVERREGSCGNTLTVRSENTDFWLLSIFSLLTVNSLQLKGSSYCICQLFINI